MIFKGNPLNKKENRLIKNTKKLFFTTLVTTILTISVFFFGVKIGLEETIIIYMLTLKNQFPNQINFL